MPQLRLVRPLFDGVYRKLGVVPLRRWYLDLTPPVDAPTHLCEVHQTMARGHLERELAQSHVEYAEFCDRQLQHIVRYADVGLDERMKEDAKRKS